MDFRWKRFVLFKVIENGFRGGSYIKIAFHPFLKRFYSKRKKKSVHLGIEFFLFRVELFSEAARCTGKQMASHKSCLTWKKDGNSCHVYPVFLKNKLMSLNLTLTTLWTDSADDKLVMFFLFLLENRIWHIMQIGSIGDNLHEVSNPIS